LVVSPPKLSVGPVTLELMMKDAL